MIIPAKPYRNICFLQVRHSTIFDSRMYVAITVKRVNGESQCICAAVISKLIFLRIAVIQGTVAQNIFFCAAHLHIQIRDMPVPGQLYRYLSFFSIDSGNRAVYLCTID